MDETPTSQNPGPPPPRSNRLLFAGAALALVAGAAIAFGLLSGQKGQPTVPPPASQAGLVIDSSDTGQDGRLDPARPLRCFVEGQPVGELTLAECARRNGVATDALDVGVDQSGALAAAGQAGTVLTPLPPEAAQPETVAAAQPADAPAAAAVTPAAASGACWRYAGGQWRKLSDMTLSSCAQTLFAGHCERPGGATYGRWSQQTLRLVPGKVEISADNRSFRTLVAQPADCSLPTVG